MKKFCVACSGAGQPGPGGVRVPVPQPGMGCQNRYLRLVGHPRPGRSLCQLLLCSFPHMQHQHPIIIRCADAHRACPYLGLPVVDGRSFRPSCAAAA